MPVTSTPGNTPTCDFAVVGGGVIGLATALALARRGARVTVVERAAGPASESSGAAAGIVSLLYPWEHPRPLQALAAFSRDLYPDWCRHLKRATGIAAGWREPGILSFDIDRAAAAERWAADYMQSVERADRERIAALAPAVSSTRGDALWLPEAGMVEPRRLAAALADGVARLGVSCLWSSPVERLRIDGKRVTGLTLANGDSLAAGAVVIAAGAWTGALLAPCGVDIPIRPVRGQVIELVGPPDLLPCIVTADYRYMLPRPGGHIVVGSTAEEVGFDAMTTPEAADALRAVAATLVPATADLPLHSHWAGLRPGSPDGMPYIGAVADVPGLWLNAGHYRNGITLAPGSAELFAALALGAEPPLDPGPFVPGAH